MKQCTLLERGIVCSFSAGAFRVSSPSGKQRLFFEDSDRFGPSKLHVRTGDLSPIPDRLRWFWDGYASWRAKGRPTKGFMTSPLGKIEEADFTAEEAP